MARCSTAQLRELNMPFLDIDPAFFAVALTPPPPPPPSAGQAVFTGTTNWPVPAGVTSISMVCVQPGITNNGVTTAQIAYAGSVVCRAQNESRVGDGGGDGGTPGPDYDDGAGNYQYGGGGGAGGYSGSGGNGNFVGNPAGTPGFGSGGSGAGGAIGDVNSASFAGGGVGLKGIGANGVANGSSAGGGGSGGSNGSGATPGSYGGGRGLSTLSRPQGTGGALAYKNNVTVVPGQVVTITVSANGSANGAARIIWGAERSYPSNAADV